MSTLPYQLLLPTVFSVLCMFGTSLLRWPMLMSFPFYKLLVLLVLSSQLVRFFCVFLSLGNGTHVLLMSFQVPFPSSLYVAEYLVRVWHPGQPVVCSVCCEAGHLPLPALPRARAWGSPRPSVLLPISEIVPRSVPHRCPSPKLSRLPCHL